MSTPMMNQYNCIKEKYKDAIVFFRLGDFYEMFYRDAIKVSELLDITLTNRQGVPMCGVPHHASTPYIKKLLELGKKVVICEQVAEKSSEKLVKREVTQIYTPGMVLEDDFLESKESNFLLIAYNDKKRFSVSYVEYSTGELGVSFSCNEEDGIKFIHREVLRLSPKEVLLSERLYDDFKLKEWLSSQVKRVASLPEWYFDYSRAKECILNHFKVVHLNSLGISDDSFEPICIGVLLSYLKQNVSSLTHLKKIHIHSREKKLFMDEATIRNLEITQNLKERTKEYSLLRVLNRTQTSMGSRLLRDWLTSPSYDCIEIERRHNCVQEFFEKPELLTKVRFTLKDCKDLERLAVRLSLEKAHARDLVFIAYSLKKVLEVQNLLRSENLQYQPNINLEQYKIIKNLYELILKTVHKEPSTIFTSGNLIAEGVSTELDSLRSLAQNGKEKLKEYLSHEQQLTGISTIKLKNNRVLGYHFEISKNYSHKVPPHFVKRQTFMSGDKYTTEDLSRLEQSIIHAEEKSLNLEKELFFKFRDSIKSHSSLFRELSTFLSLEDIYTNFAYVALEQNFSRPTILEKGHSISMKEARHPVVEFYMNSETFTANDLNLSKEKEFFGFVTGPNMSGKSTYLRQIAIILLMSQMGSFVPAQEVNVSLVDKLFCRVGASDNLARGESTFLVEMNETAVILNNATQNSFVIFDEIGRGTSTYDGLSLAWSISEYILNRVKCFTLFATHYHELVNLKNFHLKHLSLEVEVQKNSIKFLRNLQNKPSLRSYGILVAKLAGIPEEVINRSQQILRQLENDSSFSQFSLKEESNFNLNTENISELQKSLNNLSVEEITPLGALSILSEWKNKWGN